MSDLFHFMTPDGQERDLDRQLRQVRADLEAAEAAKDQGQVAALLVRQRRLLVEKSRNSSARPVS